MPLLSRSGGTATLFDIRLDNAHKNVIVLRGGHRDAASVLLSGKVVLALSEAMSIKRVTLKLVGKVRLNWTDPAAVGKTGTTRHCRFESCVFEKEWPNLEPGVTNHSSSSSSASTENSSTNISGLHGSNNNSNANISLSRSPSSTQLNTNYNTSSHTFAPGNYEFPFETVIPGSIDESIEGMEGAFVAYKLVAVVERGRFTNNLTTKKHIRIIRTLGSDVLELSQTTSIANSWPNKVDYNISVPNKAIALGSIVAVEMEFNPLVKGLKLGLIRIWLAEKVSLTSPTGLSYTYERNVIEHTVRAPAEGALNEDVWNIQETFGLPPDLSNCTQDCAIHSYIKVTHKLKFAISLKNPDGHTSELRAAIPVYVFISPNVPISTAAASSSSEQTVLFDSLSPTGPGTPNPQGIRTAELLDMTAPPNYQDHVYDRLWNDIVPANFDSPTQSGAATPSFQRSRRSSFDQHGHTPVNHSLLSNLLAGQSSSSTNSPINNNNNFNHLSSAQARSQLVDNLHELQRQQRAADINSTIHERNGAASSELSDQLSVSNSPESNILSLPRFPPPIASLRRSNANSTPSTPGGTLNAQSLNEALSHNGANPSSIELNGFSSPASRPRTAHFSAAHSNLVDHHSDSIADFSHLSPSIPSTPHGTSSSSYMNMASAFSNNSSSQHSPVIGRDDFDPQLEMLSRVPSYETAIHSDVPLDADEAPSYNDSSTMATRTAQRPSTAPSEIRANQSVTNLSSIGNHTPNSSNDHTNHSVSSNNGIHIGNHSGSHHSSYNGDSGNGSTSSLSLRRAAASATQLSTYFFGSLSGTSYFGGSPVSAGPSSAALSLNFGGPSYNSNSSSNISSLAASSSQRSVRNRSSSINLRTPSSNSNSNAGSRTVSQSVSRSESRSRSQTDSRAGSRAGSRPRSRVRSQSPESNFNGSSGLSMTTVAGALGSSNISSANNGSLTPNGDQSTTNGVSYEARSGRNSHNLSATNLAASSTADPNTRSNTSSSLNSHTNSSIDLTAADSNTNSPGGPSSSTGTLSAATTNAGSPRSLRSLSVSRSKPVSGAATPTLSASQRSHSSRYLIGEATKLLHLTKLSPK